MDFSKILLFLITANAEEVVDYSNLKAIMIMLTISIMTMTMMIMHFTSHIQSTHFHKFLQILRRSLRCHLP